MNVPSCRNLFAYGSLIFPEVLLAVTGLHLPPSPARLEGHARFTVAGATYPGVLPEAGAATPGVVYAGLHENALLRLDRFEGEYYERTAVCVSRADGSSIDADTYVFRPEFRHLLTGGPWDPETFRTDHLPRFLADYAGFTWLGEKGETT